MRRTIHSGAQALVESALVLPLVLTLSLGLVQVALYAHTRSVLMSAVQEGARLAAEDGRRLEEGSARARALLAAGLGSSVDPIHLVATMDDELVEVRVEAALRPILPVPLVRELPVHAEGRVARERFRPSGGVR